MGRLSEAKVAAVPGYGKVRPAWRHRKYHAILISWCHVFAHEQSSPPRRGRTLRIPSGPGPRRRLDAAPAARAPEARHSRRQPGAGQPAARFARVGRGARYLTQHRHRNLRASGRRGLRTARPPGHAGYRIDFAGVAAALGQIRGRAGHCASPGRHQAEHAFHHSGRGPAPGRAGAVALSFRSLAGGTGPGHACRQPGHARLRTSAGRAAAARGHRTAPGHCARCPMRRIAGGHCRRRAGSHLPVRAAAGESRRHGLGRRPGLSRCEGGHACRRHAHRARAG